MSPRRGSTPRLTDWLTDRQSQCDFDFDFGFDPVSCSVDRELSSAREAEKRWRYSSFDSSVVGYSPESNEMNTEAEESPLLRAVTKQRLVKTLQAGEDLACTDL
jgi:hypothetical protein